MTATDNGECKDGRGADPTGNDQSPPDGGHTALQIHGSLIVNDRAFQLAFDEMGPMYDRPVNYEMYMSAALSEARAAGAAGEAPDGAVAVLDEAMVARAQTQIASTGDPTAHAVVVVVREAARRLGRADLSGVVVFSAVEPCVMCVGALLESNVDGLVFAMSDAAAGAAGSVLQLASGKALPRRLEVISGIMQREAAEICGGARPPFRAPAARA